MNKHLVSVYGTLREGQGNYKRLLVNDQTVKIGTFKTKPEFTMFSLGGFPGVVKGGNTSITSEVFEVSDEVLKRLDGLEGYYANDPQQSLYIREEIDTPFGKAWTYLYNYGESNSPIESGDWLEYLATI